MLKKKSCGSIRLWWQKNDFMPNFNWRGKKIICIVLALILIIGLYFYVEKQKDKSGFRVTFFNIGQGDAALINFGDGQKMLVDCGPNRQILSKLGKYLPFYRRDLDYLLVTHPDLDHYGGCVDVLKRYKVKNIIFNGRGKAHDKYWQEWNKTMRQENAELEIINGYSQKNIAGAVLTFLSPDAGLNLALKNDDNNNYSIVFKLENKDRSYLFTGDMEEPLENALVHKYCSTTSTLFKTPTPPTPSRAEGDNISLLPRGSERELPRAVFSCPTIQANVLKVGHHGSDSSSGEEFLKLVAPTWAVISSGLNNKYGHPSFRVLKKLERVGAKILRTDEKGDIILPVYPDLASGIDNN